MIRLMILTLSLTCLTSCGKGPWSPETGEYAGDVTFFVGGKRLDTYDLSATILEKSAGKFDGFWHGAGLNGTLTGKAGDGSLDVNFFPAENGKCGGVLSGNLEWKLEKKILSGRVAGVLGKCGAMAADVDLVFLRGGYDK